MDAVASKADLSVGPAGLSVHFQNTPLVRPLVFVGMFPGIAHALEHHAERPRRARAGVFPGDEYAIGLGVIRARGGVNSFCAVFGDSLRRLGHPFEIGARPNFVCDRLGDDASLFGFTGRRFFRGRRL